MPSNVEQIKARLSIVDVVSAYLKLTKAGVSWKAPCPFHHEKTPSFYVSPVRESWHCFGCDRGGDIFSFVEEYEAVDFLGALKILADRAGIELTFEKSEGRDEKEEMKAALALATSYYEALLHQKGDALDYLKKRGLELETIKKFRIGYAPLGWSHMCKALMGRGVKTDVLEKAGLAVRSEKSNEVYDRFRGRIMFPLIDPAGTVIGFTGRLAPNNTKDINMGKYVNTPETLLFLKSKFLYGLNFAKFKIREKNSAILVEGQMDLIMSHQIGVENTIAVSGTALTEEHLAIIHRYADEIVVAFDSDTAGMKAAERAFILALSIGLNVKAILVKGGKDPADYILENKEEWRQVVEKGEHIINFMLQTIEARKAEGNEKRKLIESHVLPYVAALRSSIERAQFVHKIALELDVEDDAVWAEIRKIQAVSENGKSNSAQRIVVNPAKKEKDRILEILSRINGILVWQKSVPNSPIDVALIEDKVRKILPSAVFETNAKDAMAAELAYSNSSRLVNVELDEILMILEEEIISKQMSELLKNMKRSESKSGGSSPPDIPNLEKEYNELLMRKSILQSERRKT